MVLACGRVLRETVILDNGEWVRLRVMECMCGSMVTVIKVNLKTV